MKISTNFALFLAVCAVNFSVAEEGMYPVSEITRLNLQSHGLKMAPGEIFNADKTCLIDGLCQVNRCTGSFVSPQGLIITNHHCAYRAIQKASSSENDFLKDGFEAENLAMEIPAPGLSLIHI